MVLGLELDDDLNISGSLYRLSRWRFERPEMWPMICLE